MQKKRTASDAFILESLNKVISIVLKEKGFDGIQPQALESFSDLLHTYIDRLFTTAHLSAELGNRAKPNIHDITRSFDLSNIDMTAFKDYLQTKAHTHEANQATSYFKSIQKESTLKPTPEFLPSDNEDSDDDMDDNENGLPSYVPKHLPPFPSKHSFRQTPIYITRPDDPQKVRELNSEQSRTVEENLKKLMASENELLRQTKEVVSNNSIMMPIVNYEVFIQRRKRQKQSGTTLNVEGSDEKPVNTNNNNTTGDIENENRMATNDSQPELKNNEMVAANN